MQKYTVRVSKDYLGFCAAHFIVFGNNVCERLHGHNYQVAAEIEDDLKADHLVFDFIEFKKILQGITDSLDHRMLIPLNSDTLGVEVTEEKVRISSEEKEWIIPRDDCVLLPIENTTAELLARPAAPYSASGGFRISGAERHDRAAQLRLSEASSSPGRREEP